MGQHRFQGNITLITQNKSIYVAVFKSSFKTMKLFFHWLNLLLKSYVWLHLGKWTCQLKVIKRVCSKNRTRKYYTSIHTILKLTEKIKTTNFTLAIPPQLQVILLFPHTFNTVQVTRSQRTLVKKFDMFLKTIAKSNNALSIADRSPGRL